MLGQSHPAVTLLGERLVAHGWTGYAEGPGPVFTEVDVAAVRAFQQAQGWTGANADGFPGPTTWELLMADPPAPTGTVVARAYADPARGAFRHQLPGRDDQHPTIDDRGEGGDPGMGAPGR